MRANPPASASPSPRDNLRAITKRSLSRLKSSISTLLRRKDILVLAVLVLITVVVRVPGVFNRAIWYDEAITLLETAGNAIPTWSARPTPAATQKELLAGSPTLGEVVAGLRETDVHPPARSSGRPPPSSSSTSSYDHSVSFARSGRVSSTPFRPAQFIMPTKLGIIRWRCSL